MKYSWRNPARLAAEKLSSGLDMLCRSSINSILLAVALLGATLSACASNRSDRSQSVKPVSEVATSLPEERFLTLYGQFDAICVNADPTIEAVGKLAEQAGFARVNERALAGTGRAAWILTDERSRGGEINASTLLELRELSEAGELKLQCAISVSGSDTGKAVSRNAAEAAQAFSASIF